jgi:hypothetical protein
MGGPTEPIPERSAILRKALVTSGSIARKSLTSTCRIEKTTPSWIRCWPQLRLGWRSSLRLRLAPNGLRACTGEHAVENGATDGDLCLLGRERALKRRAIIPLYRPMAIQFNRSQGKQTREKSMQQNEDNTAGRVTPYAGLTCKMPLKPRLAAKSD